MRRTSFGVEEWVGDPWLSIMSGRIHGSRMAKQRKRIPHEVVDQIMFNGDQKCCMRLERVRLRGHHIDEDPSNNEWDTSTDRVGVRADSQPFAWRRADGGPIARALDSDLRKR